MAGTLPAATVDLTAELRTPKYAIIWLPQLEINATFAVANSVNEHSEVAGTAKLQSQSDRAFLWLPRENHSGPNGDPLAAQTLHDLGTLTGSSNEQTRALRINEAGFVAGESRGFSSGVSVSTGLFWKPNVAAAVESNSRKFSTGQPADATATSIRGFAGAISDDSEPIAFANGAFDIDGCFVATGPQVREYVHTWTESAGPSDSLVATLTDDIFGVPIGITSTSITGDSDPILVWNEITCSTGLTGEALGDAFLFDGVNNWLVPHPEDNNQFALGRDVLARDINNTQQIVGFVTLEVPNVLNGIGHDGYMWDLAVSNGEVTGFQFQTNLGQIAGLGLNVGGTDNPRDEALAVNESRTVRRTNFWVDDNENGTVEDTDGANEIRDIDVEHVQVVGVANINAVDCAFLWRRVRAFETDGTLIANSAEWDFHELNDIEIVNDDSSCGTWQLTSANDINDRGVIVGQGTFTPFGATISETRAFMLRPVSCAGDISPIRLDGTVGNDNVTVDDVVAVINNYTSNTAFDDVELHVDIVPGVGSGAVCDGGNFDVNIDDLLAVLSNFGSCGSPPSASTGSLKLQLVDFSAGWMDEAGAIDSASATAVATAWATFDASWDVYRVWVEVPDSSTYIDAVSGSEDNNTPALITNDSSTYYNNSYGSDFPPNPALFATSGFESLAFDTFLTIGNAGSAGGNPSVQGTIDLTGDTNSKSVGWYRTGGVAPVAGGSTGWRVLVGQFSVPDGDDFCISLHITGDGIDEYATVCSP